MQLTVDTMGFDPALRHGVLLYNRWVIVNGIAECRDTRVILQWTSRSPYSLTQQSDPRDFAQLTRILTSNLPHGVPVAIDWDPQSVYWTHQRLQVVVLAQFIGYFTRSAQMLGCPVLYFTPKQVRRFFGLSKTAKKEDVYQVASGRIGVPRIDSKNDVADAFLLSYIHAMGLYESERIKKVRAQ